MLVLSRKLGEEIVLPGEKIMITVLGCKGSVVRLEITAPRDTPVHRKEVWERVSPAIERIVVLDSSIPIPPSKPR